MIEILLILLSTTIFFVIGFIPFSKIFSNFKNISFFDERLFNLLSFLTLILISNLIGLNLEYITGLFYVLLVITFLFYFSKIKYLKFNIKNIISLIILFTLTFVISINIAYSPELAWEAQTIWIEKTIPLLYGEGLESLKYNPAPELPFLFPIIWSFFWNLINIQYEYLGRLIIICIYLYSIFSLVDLIECNQKNKIILFLLLFLLTFKLNGFQGDLDVLNFSLILIGSKYLYSINTDKQNNSIYLIFFLVTLNLLIYLSNEGLFYSIILITLSLFTKKISINKKFVIMFLYLFLILIRISFYKYYGLTFNLNSDDYSLSHIYFNLNIENFLMINKYLIFNILRTEFLIIGIIFYIIDFFFNKNNRNFLIFMFFANLIFIYSVFLFNEETLEYILKGRMNNLLYMSSAIFVIPILKVLNNKLKKINYSRY